MSTPLTWADHRIFDSDCGALVFGVDEASLFKLDAEAIETMRKWRGSQMLLLSEIEEAERDIIQGLADVRLLRPANVAVRGARAAAPALDPAEVPLSTLVLEVAQACNLRCTYCYAQGGSYGDEPCLLDPGVAQQSVRYLLENSGDRDQVTLIFFGGEPLMNMEAVRAATEEAEQLGRAMGKRVNFSLTTNGTLLDAETVKFLHDHRVSVAVSLDGPPHVQDRNRPDAQGRPTYDRIVENLKLLLASTPVPVAARVTLPPDQWDSVEEVFDHLMGLGFHEVGIAPASPITRDLLPTKEEQRTLLEGMRKLADRFVDESRRGRLLPFSNVLDLLGRLHVGQTKSLSCGAGYGYLAIDSKGRFFPCHRLAGEESFEVGSLDGGVDNSKVRSCLDWLDEGRREGCSVCWARTLCSGGCHYENHLRENLLSLPRGTGCDFICGWLEIGVETYAKLRSEEMAEELGKRLQMRAQC